MNRMVYVIGVPGAGKSTLLARLSRGVARASYTKPVSHSHFKDAPRGYWELGGRRDTFSGTDALGMAVLPVALKWLTRDFQWGEPWVAEGDRLATPKFWTPLREAGWDVEVVLLNTPEDEAARRREQRGSDQDPTWLKGRVSKIRNLDEHVDIELDGTKPAQELSDALRAILFE